MPWGKTRINTTAASNSATSPNTGVLRKVTTWLIEPKATAELRVPVITALPPPITVIKALAM
ncbi:hypothetical protein D3C76_1809350 [compost metagenome]